MIRAFLLIIICSLNSFGQDIEFFGKRIDADSVYFNIKNNVYAPMEVALTPKPSYEGKVKGAAMQVLKARDSIVRFGSIALEVIADTAKVSPLEYFDFSGTWGDPNTAKHNDDYLYYLPYKEGKRIKIVQSFGGKFSHNTIRSKYAIDFGTQIGDTIYAAREGIVVKTKSESKERGGRDMIDKANEVRIIHSDGTIASYVHLDYQGVFVQAGEQVERGQAIGISGFTGFTTTPHLHFVVREARNVSVPIYFEKYPNKVLKQGRRYSH